MTDAVIDAVWEESQIDMVKITNNLIRKYGLDRDFFYEGQYAFYTKFKEYYKDKKQYLSFLYTCLENSAKNMYRRKVKDSRHSSVTTDEYGGERCIFDTLVSKDNFYEELFIKEINEALEKKLEWYEYFVFKHLMDGYSKTTIKEALGITELELGVIRDNIKNEIKKYI